MAFSPKYTITAQMLANLAKIEVIKQQFESPYHRSFYCHCGKVPKLQQFIIQRRLKEIV